MDKELLKLEKEKAKKDVKLKLKQILTDKKGYWLFNLLFYALMCVFVFLINHLFHTDIDCSGAEISYEDKTTKREENFTFKKMIMNFIIIVVVCFICFQVCPLIADILFGLN